MKKFAYSKPQILSFRGWDAAFAAGTSFDPPDPGCFLPGIEDSGSSSGVAGK
ncbi:MAG: hypothetical protein AB7F40_12390 [Victivallaceae bacterium]|nr:hypothetical protein [Victivallaceae bacterium]